MPPPSAPRVAVARPPLRIARRVEPHSPPTVELKRAALELLPNLDRPSPPLLIDCRTEATRYPNRRSPPPTLLPVKPTSAQLDRSWRAKNGAIGRLPAAPRAVPPWPEPPGRSTR